MFKKCMLGVGITTALIVCFKLETSSILANTTCTTAEECQNLIEEQDKLIGGVKDELTQLEQETTQKEDLLSGVELDISGLMNRIEQAEVNIVKVSKDISQTEQEIEVSEGELAILNGDLLELKEAVQSRVRLSQRLSKMNWVLAVISGSENLIDLIRSIQMVNHFAKNDALKMEELKGLVEEQTVLMGALKEQKKSLADQQAFLNQQQVQLVLDKEVLSQKQESLKSEIQALESEKLSVADVLEIAEAQKVMLEKLAAEAEEKRKQEEEEAKKEQEEAENGGSSSETDKEEDSDSKDEDLSNGQPVATGFIIPLKTGYVSCEYMCYPNHTGIDLGNSGNTSTPVIASAAGVVIRAGWHTAYGNHVILSHNVNGKIMTTVYAHMHSAPTVSTGDLVSQGQKLGTMGNTGNSQGAHLHFEMYEGYYNYPYATNPRQYIHFPGSW